MFTLTSSAFASGDALPKRFTCDGANLSPPLAWHDAPAGTKSFVLIIDDPDAPDPKAPKRVWVHCVLYDIPPTVTELVEGTARAASVAGARDGINDSNRAGFDGPCPPVGRHRYFHKLYALDRTLGDLGKKTRKGDVERAMAGHVLATAELMGTYAR
jgi:Raf kinase inhibitor-like YbhB/YbcL family protein